MLRAITCAIRGAEGDELLWPREVALRAGTLKDWLDETGGVGTFATPLPTQALRTLRAACAHGGKEAIAALSLDETAALLHAANFLEATAVFAAAAQHLCGTLLAGKSVQELRSYLGAARPFRCVQLAVRVW